MLRTLVAALLLSLAGCRSGPAADRAPQAISLLGQPLYPPAMDDATRARREQELEEAIIWHGRRLAYLGQFRAAIDVYTQGLDLYPDSARLLRHRGHRYITLRRFEAAERDLRRAAALIRGVPDEVEPDGLPNARNTPTGTCHTNIYYHLGLACFLRGRYGEAEEAFRRCLELSSNDDMRCAASYWLYLSLRRLDRASEAESLLGPIRPDQDIIENFAYHRLLLLFKGVLSAEEVAADRTPSPVGPAIDAATVGYGLGAWHLVNERRDAAYKEFQGVVSQAAWPAFGRIACEVEIASAR